MQIVMAGSAENQRLAVTSSHDLDPEGLFPTIIGVQVFESPDMMDFDLCCESGGLTDFTDLRQEPLFQFRSTDPFPLWSVLDGCPNVPGECDPSPCCYQWLLSLTRDDDLKYLEALPRYCYLGLVLLVNLSD